MINNFNVHSVWKYADGKMKNFAIPPFDSYMQELSPAAEYEFIEPFKTEVSVGGFVGIMTKEFNVGDTIIGQYYFPLDSIKVSNESIIPGSSDFYIPTRVLRRKKFEAPSHSSPKANYRVIKEIPVGSGFLQSKDGNMVSIKDLAPKVGDIIKLKPAKESYIFNTTLFGHDYEINTGVGHRGGETTIFIPTDAVVKVNMIPKPSSPDQELIEKLKAEKGIAKNNRGGIGQYMPQTSQKIESFFKGFRGNPIAEGYKKYVVVENFTSKNYDGKTRNFKVGMNLYAKEMSSGSGSPFSNYGDIRPAVMWSGLVSYAGFEIPKNKVKEKGLNVLDQIQKFFGKKSNRNFA